jgi:long-chain fatty acid transport protein
MKMSMRQFTKCLTGFTLASSGLTLWATGFRLPDQDAFATARGEAFSATADNASAVYYNPAGLTQLDGHNLRGGVYGLYYNPQYTSPTTGRHFDGEFDAFAIPQLFYSYTFDNIPLALGVGLYSPYGLSARWSQETGFRTIATQGSVNCYTFNPTIAYQVLPNISVGAGLKVNYARTDLQQGLVWPTQPNDLFRFQGDGWAASYDLGVLWAVHQKVSIGATFRSQTTVNVSGHTEYYNKVAFPPGVPPQFQVPAFPQQKVAANADFNFPLDAVFAVSYRPTTNWNFEFDANYTDWSTLGTININQAQGFPGLIPQNVPLVLNWQASWYYEFGATRYLGKGWSVSAGYIFNENSVPDANYNPLVADLDRHFFSLGTGYKGEHFSFDAAYQFGYGPTRTVTGSAPSVTGQTADGNYKFLSHAVFLTVGWHF